MMNRPIFSELFLSNFLYDYKLSNIPNIRRIKSQVESLIKEMESGKLNSLKEEEIKSRFVTTFLGDILNFNYGNANKWMLREEKKSVTDGSKPDAVLGYFYVDKDKDDVRVVVEVKDANTNLDKKQKREKNISAVDQGFGYAHKTGGGCKWVIVTNIREIRFYSSEDSSRYQVYYLTELSDESKLKELLFLFHKDSFIKQDASEISNTDKLLKLSKVKKEVQTERLHIIDKIYYSLKRFEEFGFVDPDYIASIKPFNILKEYVWHYHDYMLFTLNPDIYSLLTQVSIDEGKIIFADSLIQELKRLDCDKALERLTWSFKFLKKCHITEIHAVRDYHLELERKKGILGVSKIHIFSCREDNIIVVDIAMETNDEVCDCIICNYRNFDFDRLIRKLKLTDGNLDQYSMDNAFGNFLLSTNDYRAPYFMLNNIRQAAKNNPEKGITYFLTTLNSTFLYHRIQMSSMEDTEQIRSDIRAIDLDKLLYNELEFYVEREVLDYLKKLRDDDLIYRVQDNVDELMEKINALKQLIDDGGSQTGPDYAYNLLRNYEKFFKHHYHNSIFYVKFQRYKKISERIFQALIISYNTPGYGLLSFNDFILTESILNIQSSKLQEILAEQELIAVDSDSLEKLLLKLKNLLKSYAKKSFFNDYIENDVLINQLQNWDFNQQYNSIFTNIFIILSRIDIKIEQFQPVKELLVAFLDIEDTLAHFNLKELENFILKRGDIFEEDELQTILNIAIRRDKKNNNKYEGLIRNIPKAFLEYKPGFRYSNTNLIKRLLLNCEREDGTFRNYRKAINLVSIADDNCKEILKKSFTQFLNDEFDDEFYEMLLHSRVLKSDECDYFAKYVSIINSKKNYRSFILGNGQKISLHLLNFILLVSKLEIEVPLDCSERLKDLNSFEMWLVNPKKFDYRNFDSDWLIAMDRYVNFLRRLSNIPEIELAIEDRLKTNFHPSLAKIKYQYLRRHLDTFESI